MGLLLTGELASATSAQRAFQVDDLFELESVGRYFGGPYAFSTDGKKLAFTRVRPKKGLANFRLEYPMGKRGGRRLDTGIGR